MEGIDSPESLRLENLKLVLDILGIIENKGGFFDSVIYSEREETSVKKDAIEEILDYLSDIKVISKSNMDWKRQIDNAKKIFNHLSDKFLLQGKRDGYAFYRKQDGKKNPDDLKYDSGYILLLVITLAFLQLDGSADLEFLPQLLFLKEPLSVALFLHYAIRSKIKIRFFYDNRRDKKEKISDFIPVKIVFRHNHWILVGFDQTYDGWNQYMLHSISEIAPETDTNKNIIFAKELPSFNTKEFYRESFGHAVLRGESPYNFVIEVPEKYYNAVRKRKDIGKWDKKGNVYHWAISAYDPEEVFTYIFRWGGKIRLIAPEEMVNRLNTMAGHIQKVHN